MRSPGICRSEMSIREESGRSQSSTGPDGSATAGACRSDMLFGSGLANRLRPTVEPLILKQLKSKEIASFNKDYDDYCCRIAYNRSIGGEDLPTRPYSSFIEPSLLNSIVKFQIKKAVA